MTGVLGHAIALSCPGLRNYTITSGTRVSVIEWFRGPVCDPKSTITRLVTMGDGTIKNKFTFDGDEKMWINPLHGDLIIPDLVFEDAGFYTCRFIGSKPQNVKLNVVSGMHNYQNYINKYG